MACKTVLSAINEYDQCDKKKIHFAGKLKFTRL